MPTLSELLGLSNEGYEKILGMSEIELSEYLKDITILEPIGCATSLEIEVEEVDKNDGKKTKTKTSKSKEKKAKSLLDADFNKLLSELTLPSDDEMTKMTKDF